MCASHVCHWGASVDAQVLHSFVCKKAPKNNKTPCFEWHNSMQLFSRYVSKEPAGLSQSEGKRVVTDLLMSWRNEKTLCWDMTVMCPLADSCNISDAARKAGTVNSLLFAKLVSRYICSFPLPLRIGNAQRFHVPTSVKPWRETGRKSWIKSGNQLSYPQMLGFGTTLQRCHVAW